MEFAGMYCVRMPRGFRWLGQDDAGAVQHLGPGALTRLFATWDTDTFFRFELDGFLPQSLFFAVGSTVQTIGCYSVSRGDSRRA